MAKTEKLHVACTRRLQPATSAASDATGEATADATGGLKALAQQVLDRNQARNRHATEDGNLCNYSGANDASKVAYPKTVEDGQQYAHGRVTCVRCSRLTTTGVCRAKSTRDTSYRPLKYVPVVLWRRCDDYRERAAT